MTSSSMEDIYKKYEFNKTEPETLMGLVKQAIETGDSVKDELKRYREITEKVEKLLEKKGIFRILDPLKIENIEFLK
jgi:predicted flap endonuclease-1-like 5' DNA nuclease